MLDLPLVMRDAMGRQNMLSGDLETVGICGAGALVVFVACYGGWADMW